MRLVRVSRGGVAAVSGCGLLVLALAAPAPSAPRPASATASPETPLRYARDIRPILSDRCFECHGPDAATRAADLRLDTPEGRAAVVVPGDPAASELWRRIVAHDPSEVMPPPGARKKPLDEAERERIRRWIVEGAAHEEHWAFVAPRRPELPDVRDATWARTPIDRFILARLEAEGVRPSPEADRATLLRRIHLDLTGLPPSERELADFLGDESSDAYERVVDRLLGEEPYRSRLAERLASPWLDGARYADTIGIHTDNGRRIWPYRDWVLAAFRDDLPYDRFLLEQLAGDLLPTPTTEQLVATGFLRAHVLTDEGGAIPEEYLVEYAVDRTATMGTVFLGLTLQCARCHDHKYDPISQEEFFSLYAYFNSVDEPGLYSQSADAERAYEPFIDLPSTADSAAIKGFMRRIAELDAELATTSDADRAALAAFVEEIRSAAGLAWSVPTVRSARSVDPAVRFDVGADGTIVATGALPDEDAYAIELDAEGPVRLLALEALAADGRGPGRAANGNAVVTDLRVAWRPRGDEGAWRPTTLRWAAADHEQQDGDYAAGNALGADRDGWALDAHRRPEDRLLVALLDEEIAAPEGISLRVEIDFRSPYAQHSLARLRLRTSPFADALVARLPLAAGPWRVRAPQPFASGGEAWEASATPSEVTRDDGAFRVEPRFVDGIAHVLPDGVGVIRLVRTIHAPSERSVEVSLGSDDGFRLFVNGAEVAARRVERGAAPDQDRATLPLRAGENTIEFAIVNTGGQGGFAWRMLEGAESLREGLVLVLAPDSESRSAALELAWRRAASPRHRKAEIDRYKLAQLLDARRATIPTTMVMRELPTPRETFVLSRGAYDQPDRSRPVARGVPSVLGALAPDAPANRLGLAEWMVHPEHPLTARVAVNRFWELLFGTGLVRTSEDFGLQGEWPSHPELLDWLAIEFREQGWSVHRLLRTIVLSATYRQASTVREDLRERDPDNRLLAFYPRRRLAAEQIRDLALAASGLLVERFGGPSVRPAMPEGLWQEVAMLQSNTREYRRGVGDDLRRRSLYTYWKRASPPPTLLLFDAPTRESCVVRRPSTNTPLQALALWNDEEFVEAARVLAEGLLAEPIDDDERLARLLRRLAARTPDAEEIHLMRAALEDFRTRYRERSEDAARLASAGTARRRTELDPADVAAWTMLAGAALTLHETLTQD